MRKIFKIVYIFLLFPYHFPSKKRYCHFEQSRVPHINAYFMLSLLNIGPVILKNNIFKSRQSTYYFVMIFPGNFENLEFPSTVRMLALCHICWNWSNTWFMRRCRKCEMFTIRRPNYEQHAVRNNSYELRSGVFTWPQYASIKRNLT